MGAVVRRVPEGDLLRAPLGCTWSTRRGSWRVPVGRGDPPPRLGNDGTGAGAEDRGPARRERFPIDHGELEVLAAPGTPDTTSRSSTRPFAECSPGNGPGSGSSTTSACGRRSRQRDLDLEQLFASLEAMRRTDPKVVLFKSLRPEPRWRGRPHALSHGRGTMTTSRWRPPGRRQTPSSSRIPEGIDIERFRPPPLPPRGSRSSPATRSPPKGSLRTLRTRGFLGRDSK